MKPNFLVGMAGCGGIGSNVAWMLARSGIQNFVLVDFDRIEESNLNRQFYFARQIGRPKAAALAENLLAINPDLRLRVHELRLTADNAADIFRECDMVVEGFDGREAKKMLLENLPPQLPVASACGIAGADLAGVRTRRLGQCRIAGDFATDCADARLYAHKVACVAAHMAQYVIEEANR